MTFHFPRDNQTEDYVGYSLDFPQMNDGTVCLWIDSKDFAYSVPISYSVNGENHEWLIFFDSQQIGIFLGGEVIAKTDNVSLDGVSKVGMDYFINFSVALKQCAFLRCIFLNFFSKQKNRTMKRAMTKKNSAKIKLNILFTRRFHLN